MEESTKIIEGLQVRAAELMLENKTLRERAAIAEKQLEKVGSMFIKADTALGQLEPIVGRENIVAAIRRAVEIIDREKKAALAAEAKARKESNGRE